MDAGYRTTAIDHGARLGIDVHPVQRPCPGTGARWLDVPEQYGPWDLPGPPACRGSGEEGIFKKSRGSAGRHLPGRELGAKRAKAMASTAAMML